MGAWLCYLFFQHGHAWDEAEHAHAAWLVSRGKAPLDDFFQHHQPLLWSVMAWYFRLGFAGPAVLIWGRTVVAICAVIAAASLAMIGRDHQDWRLAWATAGNLGAWLGVVWFVAFTVALPELFVIRPETLASACILLSLALWCGRMPIWTVFLAGTLAGASCYSSPRFLLMGGFFVLMGVQSKRRWLVLLFGGVSFIWVYMLGAGSSVDKILFNLRFSAYLQTVGDGQHGISLVYLQEVALAAVLPLVLFIPLIQHGMRQRAVMLVAYTVVVVFACEEAAGLFRYAQAYAPATGAAAVTAAWLGARLDVRHRFYGSGLRLVVLLGIVAGGYEIPRLPRFDFLKMLAVRAELAASIPAGEKALIYALHSPVTVEDASYYGSPNSDSQNRLCRAIRGFKSAYPLPECDFFKVLKDRRPFVTEAGIGRIMDIEDRAAAQALLASDYAVAAVAAQEPRYMTGVLTRRAEPRP